MTELRDPRTLWDYSVSMADLLTRWQARFGGPAPELLAEPLRTHLTVVLAAAVHQRAHLFGLQGPDVLEVGLAAVLRILREHPEAALHEAPALPGTGRTERQALLDRHGGELWEQALAGAITVAEGHLADAQPDATLRDRQPHLQQAITGRQTRPGAGAHRS